jgi:hypothetical protein
VKAVLFAGRLPGERVLDVQKREEREADKDQENRDECLKTGQRRTKVKGGDRLKLLDICGKRLQ